MLRRRLWKISVCASATCPEKFLASFFEQLTLVVRIGISSGFATDIRGEARNELLNLEGECRRALEMIGQPRTQRDLGIIRDARCLERFAVPRLRLELSKAESSL